MKLDITTVLNGKTPRLPFEFELTLGDGDILPPPDVKLTDPISVRGEVADHAGYIGVSAELSVAYETACVRCLDTVAGEFTCDFTRTVAAEGTDIVPDDDDGADDYVAPVDGVIDLDRDIAEELILGLPTVFLCREDCPGLCPECGHRLADGDCGCSSKKKIDPRLAILQKLLEKDEDL